MANEAPETKPLTTREAHSLLASLRYAQLSPVLRDPEFAMLTALVFAGFRVDANGYANPMVRKRLAEEAVRNDAFAAKLRELVRESPAPRPAIVPAPGTGRSEPERVARVEEQAREPYRIERDRLRRERDDEIERRRRAESELAQAKMDALAAATGRGEAVREVERLKMALDRSERKLRRAEIVTSDLRKLAAARAAHEPRASTPAKTAEARPDARIETDFIDAVRRLIEKPDNNVGSQIANEVLRQSPENEDALEIQAAASARAGDKRGAAQALRALIAVRVRTGRFAQAARPLASLFEIEADLKTAREFFAAARQAGADGDALRGAFEPLRVASPAIHRALRGAARPEQRAALFDKTEKAVGVDEPLPLAVPAAGGRPITARAIVGCVDAGDNDLFDSLRSSLSTVSADDRTRIGQAIAAASGGDDSYWRLLTRSSTAGPVVVDASNAAWNGQEMLSNPRPRMSHILAVRRALRLRGHFPICLIADANLAHVVDDPRAARRMIASGEIVLATSGTDADEQLLREARRLGAPVVTNDYMTDWDPAQSVRKLQFVIAHTTGEASIYEP